MVSKKNRSFSVGSGMLEMATVGTQNSPGNLLKFKQHHYVLGTDLRVLLV